jgi:hypothetical protein
LLPEARRAFLWRLVWPRELGQELKVLTVPRRVLVRSARGTMALRGLLLLFLRAFLFSLVVRHCGNEKGRPKAARFR